MTTATDESTLTQPSLELGMSPDRDRHCTEFSTNRRTRVVDFLKPAEALRLYRHLDRDVQWHSFLAADGKLLAASPGPNGSYSAELEKAMFERAVASARNGLSFWYEANRLFAEDLPNGAVVVESPGTPMLTQLHHTLNSAPFLDLLRAITGIGAIAATQIQATRHRAGHFASFVTAPPAAPGVCAAFAINMTLEWMPEWGGLREFSGKRDYSVEAYIPSFNVLDIFALPQGHWISQVTPFASASRLEISGRIYTH